ncbi:MAG TPA: lysoplasmalogenase [Chitinophagaceae bacterium]|nr:lysoplasmalogenase [Chitinophagaceae bacterium]
MLTVSSTETRGNLFLYLFFAALALELLFISIGYDMARYFSKPLLMLILGAYFMSNTVLSTRWRAFVIAALAFSWLGDILLMFESREPLFFLFGLSAFLLAHICYILFFHRVRAAEQVKSRAWLLIIVAIYYASLITFLYPYLGGMKIPVPVYGIVISFMLLLALHLFFIPNRQAGLLMLSGAVLFVISDSILAINKFYRPFNGAGLLIMLTYGLAQFFIVRGAILYARSVVAIPAAKAGLSSASKL